MPGFETFGPTLEVCHCDKPRAGPVDAPRAFHLKLATVLRGERHFSLTKTDEEVFVLHRCVYQRNSTAPKIQGNNADDLVAIVAIACLGSGRHSISC